MASEDSSKDLIRPVDLNVAPEAKDHENSGFVAAILMCLCLGAVIAGVYIGLSKSEPLGEPDSEGVVSLVEPTPTTIASAAGGTPDGKVPVTPESKAVSTVPPTTVALAQSRLDISSIPEGATVLVGDQFKGMTPFTISLPGDQEHALDLVVQKAGFAPQSATLVLAPGEKRSVRLELTAREGEVLFRINPSDANVWLDNRVFSPGDDVVMLPATVHTLRVEKSGYDVYETSFTPRVGTRSRIDVNLQKIGLPPTPVSMRPTPVPQRVASSQGAPLQRVDLRGKSYTVGSSRREHGRRSNETKYPVAFSFPLYVGEREVSNREYRAFKRGHKSGEVKGRTLDGANQPVVNVTWEDAIQYCNWLSKREGLPEGYVKKEGQWVWQSEPGTGYRLLTEAEWETIAREGKENLYPWGKRYPPGENDGNFADASAKPILGGIMSDYLDGQTVTAEVGFSKPNAFNIKDMAGNVAEWVHDGWTIPPKRRRAVKDPMGGVGKRLYVIKGSSWRDATRTELRCAFRQAGDEAQNDVGFRICRKAAN